MTLMCYRCSREIEPKVKEVIFSNGTKHLEAKCPDCKMFIKYLAHNPDQRPHDHKIYFGKYKGKTLGEIQRDDPGYFLWLYNFVQEKGLRNLVKLIEKM